MQREKDFRAYEDIESRFERRPSLWFEPIGDWGEGGVVLFEIPTNEEVHDNIAAFWHPKGPFKAKSENSFTYRLHWGADVPKPHSLARFIRTGVGARGDAGKLFVLDLAGDRLKTLDAEKVKGVVSSDKAEVSNIVTQPNPETGGWRLSFQVGAKDAPVELRAVLMEGDMPVSEVWVYRWAP
jgi:glucans biosynthesis protein